MSFNGTNNSINLASSASGSGTTISAAVNFTNGLTVNTGGSGTYTMGGVVSGSGGLVKNGSVALILSGANTYTGGTIVNGTLWAANNGAFGAGTVLLNSGAIGSSGASRTLANAIQIGSNFTLGDGNNNNNTTLSGTVDLLGGTRTLTTAGSNSNSSNIVTLSGAISNGGIVKEGRTLLVLSGTNSYTGGTTINNGVLQFDKNASIPSTGTVTVNEGGTLALNATSGNQTVASWLASGKLSTASTGTIALTGVGTGNVDFNTTGYAGLYLGAFANTTYTGTLTQNGTTYRLGGGGATLTLSNVDAVAGANSLFVGPALSIGSVSTSLIPTQTTVSGSVVAFSNANSLSGTTTVNSGTLSLTGAAGALASSDVTVKSGAILNFAPNSASSVTRVKSVTLNGGTLSVTGSAFATTDTITNALTLNSGANTVTVTPNATGANTLSAGSLARTSGQGWALVNGLNLGQDATTTANVGRIKFTAAPTLVGTTAALSTGINSANKDTVIVPWMVGAVTATTGGTGTASGTANTFLTYDTSTGLRPLNLTDEFTSNAITAGNNTYITANTAAASTAAVNSLIIGGTDSAVTLTVNSGITLTNTSGALLFASTNTIGGATGTLGLGTAEGIVTVNTGKTGTITTGITGSAGLSKFGAGTLTLTGAKAYTGATTINNGFLSTNSLANGGVASGIGAGSTAATDLVFNGGTLTYTGAAVSTNRLFSIGLGGAAIRADGTGGITFTNTGALGFNGESGDRILTLSGGQGTGVLTSTLAAVIGDFGGATSVLKTVNGFTAGNASTWVLSGANTYTGATMILGDTNNLAGILSISSIANGGVTSNIGKSTNAASNLVLNRGTLQYTGAGASTDRLFTIGSSAGGASLDASGTGALTFSNTGAVAFTGSGVRLLTLTGTNTGANTLALLIGDSGSAAAPLATSLTKSGTGTWQVTNANTYTGATTISAAGGILGTSTLANGGVASGIGASSNAATNLLIGNGGTLQYTGATASTDRLFTVNGTAAAHSATLDASGTGAVNFTNTGNVAYGTINQTRTLNLTGTNTGANTLAATIANNGTGAVTVNKNGGGTWVLSGTNTYTGATSINGGTLLVNGSIASSAVAIASGATLGGSGTVGTISGAGMVGPGNSPGILSASSVNPTAGTDFSFQLAVATPVWSSAGSPGNDVLRLTGATPITTAMTSANVINVYFGSTGTFVGGIYTDTNADFTSLVSAATFNYYMLDGIGGVVYDGQNYSAMLPTDASWTAVQVASANFSGGTVTNGWAMEFSAVPEPSTYALLGMGLGVLWFLRRKKATV